MTFFLLLTIIVIVGIMVLLTVTAYNLTTVPSRPKASIEH